MADTAFRPPPMAPRLPQPEQAGLGALIRMIVGSAMSGDFLSHRGDIRRDVREFSSMMADDAIRELTDVVTHPESFIGPGRLGMARAPLPRGARPPAPEGVVVPSQASVVRRLERLGMRITEVRRDAGGSTYVRFEDPAQPFLPFVSQPYVRIAPRDNPHAGRAGYTGEAGVYFEIGVPADAVNRTATRARGGRYQEASAPPTRAASVDELEVRIAERFGVPLVTTQARALAAGPRPPRPQPDPNQPRMLAVGPAVTAAAVPHLPPKRQDRLSADPPPVAPAAPGPTSDGITYGGPDGLTPIYPPPLAPRVQPSERREWWSLPPPPPKRQDRLSADPPPVAPASPDGITYGGPDGLTPIYPPPLAPRGPVHTWTGLPPPEGGGPRRVEAPPIDERLYPPYLYLDYWVNQLMPERRNAP